MGRAEQLITKNLGLWSSAVKAKSSAGRGSSKKRELYGISKLRDLILDLAVRGLLEPQSKEDEAADALLQTVRKIEEQLVTTGELKKPKKSPHISSEEVPFQIPAGWSWKRLAEIGLIGSSSRVEQKDWKNEGVPFYRAREIVTLSKTGKVDNDLFISEEHFAQLLQDSLAPSEGDIMITGVGTIGVPYIVQKSDKFYFKDASVLIFKNFANLYPDYYYLLFKSPYWIKEIHKESMGTTVHTLTISRARLVPLPIPPLAEQHRIVAKVNELMSLCDQLEEEQENNLETHETLVSTLLNALTSAAADASQFAEAWQRIQANFDILFTTESSVDQLKQAILQLAVMGKLVEQDPGDEPAKNLLQNFHETKQKLVLEGKAKRSKNLPSIKSDETPFEIPQQWKWCKLGETGEFINGDRGKNYPNKSEYVEEGLPWINTGHIEPDGTLTKTSMNYITKQKYESLNSGKIKEGDLVYCLRGATFGKTAFTTPYSEGAIASSLMIIRPYIGDLGPYLYKYLTSPFGKSQIFRFDNGSAQPNLSANSVKLYALPLPPLAEQNRIVAKVDELMALCDQLKAKLSQAQETQLKLADSIVEQAIHSPA